MLRIAICVILFGFGSQMANASQLTVGYVPISFPRDPVEFNQFDEHIIVGQILEPLVDADGGGKVGPSIAKEWHFSKDGLLITFRLDEKKKFSNGKSVTAKDVAYSLKRHMSTNSQSKGFLSAISEISAADDLNLKIQLKQKNVAILKSLTRDQLGIVPDGWKFDSESNSPYLGTGPYNLEKVSGQWLLKKNQNFKKYEVPVDQWKLVFYKDDKFTPADTIPDLMPSMTASILEKVKSNPRLEKEGYQIDIRLGFTQSSFWVDPRGSLYSNPEKRLIAQSFLNELIHENVKSNNFQRSTGMIPVGIEGSLQKMPEIQSFKKGPLGELRIASLGGAFAKYLTEQKIAQIKEKYAVQVYHQNFSFLELKELGAWKADIIAGAWAGGFNDPAGFLGLLNVIFGIPFKDYLENLGKQLEQTERQDDWGKRATEFRELGAAVIKSGLMTPGWRIPMYEVKNNAVQNIQFQTRYTPRLVNYKVKK